MIQLCTCTGSLPSSLHYPNSGDNSKTCKRCGGELTLDKRGPLCGNMLNTMGLELPRPIDPEVRWKTAGRGRQRAVRRARTSFSGEDKMKATMRTSHAGDDVMGQESNAQEDIPVSESEKLGVSILGRRFSDPVENVPIKKRKFLMARSPSPQPSLLKLDQSEQFLSSSCGDISSYGKHHRGRTRGSEGFCAKDLKKGLSDAADFSGISILAAAACESGMQSDMLNGECSMPDHSLKERKLVDIMRSTESRFLCEIKEGTSKTLDGLHGTSDRPLESSASAPDKKPSFFTGPNSLDKLDESAYAHEANSSVFSAVNSLKNPEKSASAPDAKSSVATALNSSSNLDEFAGCLQAKGEKSKRVDTARDSRLHWDLNVAMEVWDNNCGGDDGNDDMVCSNPPVVAAANECNDTENEMNEPQACNNPFDSKDTREIPDLSGDKIPSVDVPQDIQMKEESDVFHDSSSLPSCCSAPNLQLLESASLNRNNSSSDTKVFLDQQKSSYASEVESHLISNPNGSSLAPIMEHAALTADVKKPDDSHALLLKHEVLSHIEGLGGGNPSYVSDLDSRVGLSISKPLSEESTNLATISAFNKSFADQGLNDTQLGQAAQQSISEFEKQEFLDVDSGSSKIDLSVDKKVEDGSEGLCITKKPPDSDVNVNLSDPHLENDLVSADIDILAHRDVGAATTHTMADNSCSINDANTSSAKTFFVDSAVSHTPSPNLEHTELADAGTDCTMDSQVAAKSCPNGYENNPGKVASNDSLKHFCATGASHIGKDLAGMGKIDLEEDDSQYEDGELRESDHHYWGNDVYEEVDHVDYEGSDYKDNEHTSDIPPLSLPISNKNLVLPVGGDDGVQSRKKDSDVAVSPVSLKCSSATNYLDSGPQNWYGKIAGEKTCGAHLRVEGDARTYEMDTSLSIAGSAATDSRFGRGGNGLGDHPLNIRTKSTGWDRLPEGLRCSHHVSRDGADSANRTVVTTSDAARGGDLLRQIRSSSNRDVQSRLERPRSFDGPSRNDLCRSDDGYRSGSKVERTIGAHRSLGRGGASRHTPFSGRGEQWVGTPNRSGSTRHRSPDYYGYGPAGPRNAAEAAVAKMESSGFVVAPDGTLVKAVDATATGHMPRRMRNTSLNGLHRALSGRGSPIDRDGACVTSRGPARAREASPDRHFVLSGNRSGRYGPDIEKDHVQRVALDGTMSSAHRPLSRRQRSFSPHGASVHLSRACTRSPSRSRSRSPPGWSSSRGRRDIVANGGSSLRRHSRSPPNYRTEVRMDRMTSPQRRPGFDDQIMHYSPSARNHSYSQHTTRCVDGRKCSPVDLRDHGKRYAGRSPPLRIASRNDRFDLMDSQGRPRSGEFYRPTQGRFPYGLERGNKHDGNGDDGREYTGRYENLHSARPYDRNGTVKQFRNDAGDNFRLHNSSRKSTELQRRGSPRRFERGFERQLAADFSHGNKKEKDPFKYD